MGRHLGERRRARRLELAFIQHLTERREKCQLPYQRMGGQGRQEKSQPTLAKLSKLPWPLVLRIPKFNIALVWAFLRRDPLCFKNLRAVNPSVKPLEEIPWAPG